MNEEYNWPTCILALLCLIAFVVVGIVLILLGVDPAQTM